MASCIHPSCKCRAYQDSKHCKGSAAGSIRTLLQLRLGCQVCSHQASEHRQLTEVDKFIETEVTAAAKNRCTHFIPLAEVPCSPVFKSYDPIPLPLDDAAPNKEGQVPCTCTGFQVNGLVKLWQRFRTFNMNDAMSTLPQVNCSFCQHSLLCHQSSEATTSVCQSGSLRSSLHLMLDYSAKVDFVPLKGKCLQVIPPKESLRDIVFLALKMLDDDNVDIVLNISNCVSEKQTSMNAIDNPNTTVDQASPKGNTSKGAVDIIPVSTEKQDNIPQQCPKTSVESAGFEPVVHQPTEALSKELTGTSTTKKRRKRSRVPSVSSPRRSTRIASKKQKVSVPSGQDAGPSKLHLKEVLPSNSKEAALCAVDESKEVLMRETVKTFASSLQSSDNWKQYRLPEEVSSSGIHLMAATPYSDLPCNRGEEMRFLLALAGRRPHKLFACALATDMHWAALQQQSPEEGVTSLSWREQSDRCSHNHLCVGTSSGTIYIWNVHVATDSTSTRLRGSCIGSQKHTDAEITTCSWAPCGRLLVAGSLLGEVLIYSLEETSLHLVHTFPRCSGAPVTCTAWSTDCSLLAVGASDDCIQVLRCSKPSDCTTALLQPSQNTILGYFKRDTLVKRKFTHTYCLAGHQSFLAGLSFTGAGATPPQLVSVGWDGQILFWQDIFDAANIPNDKESLPYTEREPQAGFKLGPSAAVEFIPLAVNTLSGYGVLVVLRDKTGGVTIVTYKASVL